MQTTANNYRVEYGHVVKANFEIGIKAYLRSPRVGFTRLLRTNANDAILSLLLVLAYRSFINSKTLLKLSGTLLARTKAAMNLPLPIGLLLRELVLRIVIHGFEAHMVPLFLVHFVKRHLQLVLLAALFNT